jgi:hypothetical protein
MDLLLRDATARQILDHLGQLGLQAVLIVRASDRELKFDHTSSLTPEEAESLVYVLARIQSQGDTERSTQLSADLGQLRSATTQLRQQRDDPESPHRAN